MNVITLFAVLLLASAAFAAVWEVYQGTSSNELRVRCGKALVVDPCVADIDGDGKVGAEDFGLLSKYYGATCYEVE